VLKLWAKAGGVRPSIARPDRQDCARAVFDHMIFPSNRVWIVVATKLVDFRKGHDGLAALVKNELRKDPFTGPCLYSGPNGQID